jgi:predicted P-loop ATPase
MSANKPPFSESIAALGWGAAPEARDRDDRPSYVGPVSFSQLPWIEDANEIKRMQADIAIILISTQGTGKTSSIKAMVPHADEYVELSLLDRDEDLSRAMRGKLIGEMAELRGLNSRDLESIKAWISRQREEWVPKYLEFSRTFPRRLVLVGTSNQEEFLADETGNRRFAPIIVGERQDRDGIVRDREQLWAEAAVLFEEKGVLWQEVELLAKAEHGRFEIHDAWLETVRDWLHEPGLEAKAPAD